MLNFIKSVPYRPITYLILVILFWGIVTVGVYNACCKG